MTLNFEQAVTATHMVKILFNKVSCGGIRRSVTLSCRI